MRASRSPSLVSRVSSSHYVLRNVRLRVARILAPCIFATLIDSSRIAFACSHRIERSDGLSEKWGTSYIPVRRCMYARARARASRVERAELRVACVAARWRTYRVRGNLFFKCRVSIISTYRKLSCSVNRAPPRIYEFNSI